MLAWGKGLSIEQTDLIGASLETVAIGRATGREPAS
jgi:hypothetical protein